MMMSLNEILPPASPSCLLSASRASAARSMSISVVRKKCGIGPIDATRRLAIVFLICVSGTSSYGTPVRRASCVVRGAGAATAAAGDGGDAGAPSTSRLITRPPGPEPWTSLRSTPASLAIRFASGDAFTRVASAAAATGTGAGAGAADLAAGSAAAGAGLAGAGAPSPSTFSPGFPIQATTFHRHCGALGCHHPQQLSVGPSHELHDGLI